MMMWLVTTSGDGSKMSRLVVGDKEAARKALVEEMYYGSYEEALKDEFITGHLEDFDNEDNWCEGIWSQDLEQGWLEVARVDRWPELNLLPYSRKSDS